MAILTIASHEFIPHHHHFDSVLSHPENVNCTDNDHQDADHPAEKNHCHAFNDVVIDKLHNVRSNLQLNPEFIAILLFDDLQDQPAEETLTGRITQIDFVISPLDIFTEAPLRAPPALS